MQTKLQIIPKSSSTPHVTRINANSKMAAAQSRSHFGVVNPGGACASAASPSLSTTASSLLLTTPVTSSSSSGEKRPGVSSSPAHDDSTVASQQKDTSGGALSPSGKTPPRGSAVESFSPVPSRPSRTDSPDLSLFLEDLESEDESISVHESSSDEEYAPPSASTPASRKSSAAKKKKEAAAAAAAAAPAPATQSAKARKTVVKTERKVRV